MPIFIWIGFVSFSQMNVMKAANKDLKVMVKTIEIEDTDVCIITLVLLPALSDLAIYVSLLHL
jgi:hypothetical protein